ncbi:hypothetical protein AAKU55_005963 [Oxalobacteraceae bacterium GrIS 1.11]
MQTTTSKSDASEMTIEQKGKLIVAILRHLKFAAKSLNKAFDEDVTFFTLAFMSDTELQRIARLVVV